MKEIEESQQEEKGGTVESDAGYLQLSLDGNIMK